MRQLIELCRLSLDGRARSVRSRSSLCLEFAFGDRSVTGVRAIGVSAVCRACDVAASTSTSCSRWRTSAWPIGVARPVLLPGEGRRKLRGQPPLSVGGRRADCVSGLLTPLTLTALREGLSTAFAPAPASGASFFATDFSLSPKDFDVLNNKKIFAENNCCHDFFALFLSWPRATRNISPTLLADIAGAGCFSASRSTSSDGSAAQIVPRTKVRDILRQKKFC